MSRVLFGIIVVSACGGAAPPHAAVANQAAATPFGRADLAVRSGGDLFLYSLAGDHLPEVLRVHLADHVDGSFLAMEPHQFDWADRDHLIAAMGHSVTIVSAAGNTPLE